MNDFMLENELEKLMVLIDVEKLSKSNIKQIKIKLPLFVDLIPFDKNGNLVTKKELITCLNEQDAENAKTLNKIYQESIYNLLDENIQKNINLEDFIG